jgi:hypothetical protein
MESIGASTAGGLRARKTKEIQMAEGRRPGGLTALAVLNFVFGGIGALLTLFALLAIGAAHQIGSAVERSGGTVHSGPGTAILYLNVLLLGVSAFLLIISGVGYIKQKKFMGRTLGTAYAVVSLGSTIMNFAFMGGGVGLGTVIFSVYPILTLIMVNTTFKDDLVN